MANTPAKVNGRSSSMSLTQRTASRLQGPDTSHGFSSRLSLQHRLQFAPATHRMSGSRPCTHGRPDVQESTVASARSLAGQTVWVVDAHSLIHQVFHAIPDMTSPSGQPVNAVYGFTRDLLYLLESKQPDFLFCAFDLPGKTFRHELYEQYKAGRPEMHEDLVPQIAFVHRMVEALGIPLLDREGFEADDVLATVARLTDDWAGDASSSAATRTAGN